MTVLTTDRRATQCVENVSNLLASIKKYYQINHQESHGDCDYAFGKNSICEHHINYSPYRGGHANLFLTKIDSDFVKKITCQTVSQIINQEKTIRNLDGNGTANALPLTYDEVMFDFFKTRAVKLEIDSYGLGKINFRINIELLSHEVLDAISEILKHTELLPKAQSTRTYEL